MAGVPAPADSSQVSGVLASENAGAAAAGLNGDDGAAGAPLPAPAVLKWSDLSYRVALKTRRTGCGGGAFGFLAGGCRYPELSVLSRVSGFAGATNVRVPAAYLVDGASTAAALGGKSLSISSGLSAAAAAEGRAGHPTSMSPGGGGGGSSVADNQAATAVLAGQKYVAVDAAAAEGTGTAAANRTMPSTITGILGPSGAGKSSLLDILAGRKRSGEGRAVGNVSLAVDGCGGGGGGPSEIRRVAGYVPQEDVLPGTLSCYEHLMFHARLRMPRSATHAERRARALLVLTELGLSRVADSRVGDARRRGLSGGEKRRLSIAAELMARPPLLFLDEPTTGLGADCEQLFLVRLCWTELCCFAHDAPHRASALHAWGRAG